MEPFVTQEQCEQRRQVVIDENKLQTKDISELRGEMKAMTVEIKHLVAQNKWFMGICSSVLGGLMLWLITAG